MTERNTDDQNEGDGGCGDGGGIMPRGTSRAVCVLAAEADPAGRADRRLVTIGLECGCVVTRTMDANRVMEVSGRNGDPAWIVAGKFLCPTHGRAPA